MTAPREPPLCLDCRHSYKSHKSAALLWCDAMPSTLPALVMREWFGPCKPDGLLFEPRRPWWRRLIGGKS
jgi:hypothetical protein